MPLPKAGLDYLKQQVYTITNMTKLKDLLAEWWYIQGLNLAGDFCFVTPGSVLKHNRGRPDYQMQSDSTISKKIYGKGCQLILCLLGEWNMYTMEQDY